MDQEVGTRCMECGARMGAGADWCPQCFTKVERGPKFAPPDAFLGPPPPRAYSRTVKTSVTFGLGGRLVATVLLVVVPVGLLLTFVFPFGVIYLVAAVPILLASIWKKTPVPPERDSSRR